MTSKNSIFIWIPKCAGTTIARTVKKHKVLIETTNNPKFSLPSTDKAYDNYFKFCFVRNPWDRTVSNWKMFSTWRKPHGAKNLSFPQFISFLHEEVELKQIKAIDWGKNAKNINHRYAMRNHSASFLNPFYQAFDENQNVLVDFIGRFESLQEDFNKICEIINIPLVKLPHHNSTKRKHYSEYYNKETREMVRQRYARDIEYFGYEFEE